MKGADELLAIHFAAMAKMGTKMRAIRVCYAHLAGLRSVDQQLFAHEGHAKQLATFELAAQTKREPAVRIR